VAAFSRNSRITRRTKNPPTGSQRAHANWEIHEDAGILHWHITMVKVLRVILKYRNQVYKISAGRFVEESC
jgi:hypothetical protein